MPAAVVRADEVRDEVPTHDLARLIRDEGTSAILVEQNAQKILGVTDRAAILERGAVVYQSTSAALAADRSVLETYLGVTDQGPRRGRQAH